MSRLRSVFRILGIDTILAISLACGCATRTDPGYSTPSERASQWERPSLPDSDQVKMGGVWGNSFYKGYSRLGQDPFSVPFILADVNFGMKRWFTNFSGDISGRFLEVASVTSRRGHPDLPALRGVMSELPQYHKADGHFGADVAWSAPIDFSTSSDQTTVMPILWGNGRLLLGLVAAQERFGDPGIILAARRLGDFYVKIVVPRFCDPDRMTEYRQEAWYAASYVTCVFEGMEGLVRLYRLTGSEPYLRAAMRMADFHAQFDRLPTGHAHGSLSQHTALLLLYEVTGDPKYLKRVTSRWTEAVDGGYVNPAGGILEKFWVTGYDRDEGCAEADWLRLNLLLWSNTGETKYLDMAERLLWNHYLANQWPTGGFGHRKMAFDDCGPYAFRELHQESLWCCSFHCPLGLHDLKSFLATTHRGAIWLNFPVDFTATLTEGGDLWNLTMKSLPPVPGVAIRCELAVEGGSHSLPLRLRIPDWADEVVVHDSGRPMTAVREGNYLRVENGVRSGARLEIAYRARPFLEDRRFHRIVLPVPKLSRLERAVLRYGPHVLMNSSSGEVQDLALKTVNGEIQLPDRAGPLRVLPWSELPDPEANHSFVFNVVVKENSDSTSGSRQQGEARLGISGPHFTLNGRPAFLLGFSYYAGLGAAETCVDKDLDYFQSRGFNWLRVWATWSSWGVDVSALDPEGRPREPYWSRLRRLVAECDRRGMVVDVTLTRGKAVPGSAAAGRLTSFPAHQLAVENLAKSLRDYRNWYLDLANERDVRDDRYVPPSELKALREKLRQIDPLRLVTASFGGHDLNENDIREALLAIGVDFLAPHRPRTPTTSTETEGEIRACLDRMKALNRLAPVHLQEPFRRGYTQWEPQAADFLTDLKGAVTGGAAGWCFHNGQQRDATDEQPRRSFDLRTRCLQEQLDPQERQVVTAAAKVVADSSVR